MVASNGRAKAWAGLAHLQAWTLAATILALLLRGQSTMAEEEAASADLAYWAGRWASQASGGRVDVSAA